MSSHPVFSNVTTPSNNIFDDFATGSSMNNNFSPEHSVAPSRPLTTSTTMPTLRSADMATSPAMNNMAGRSPRTNTNGPMGDAMSSLIKTNLSQMGSSAFSTPYITPNQSTTMIPSASIPSGLGNHASSSTIPLGLMNRSRTMGLTDIRQTQPPSSVSRPTAAMPPPPQQPQPQQTMNTFGDFQRPTPTPVAPYPFSSNSNPPTGSRNPAAINAAAMFTGVTTPMPSFFTPASNNQSSNLRSLPVSPPQMQMQMASTPVAPYPFSAIQNPPPGSSNPAASNAGAMLSGVMTPMSSSLPPVANNNANTKALSKRDIDDLLS